MKVHQGSTSKSLFQLVLLLVVVVVAAAVVHVAVVDVFLGTFAVAFAFAIVIIFLSLRRWFTRKKNHAKGQIFSSLSTLLGSAPRFFIFSCTIKP